MLATQCLPRLRPRTMRILYTGELPLGVTPKDVILGTIGRIGVGGAAGHVLEYAGAPISALSMEGRLTICNMSIEAGRARDDRSGRHDLRLPRRQAGSPEGATGSAHSSAGASCAPTTTPCSTTRSRSTSPNWSRR